MSSESTVSVRGLGRMYHLYEHPRDRLKQAFLWGRRQLYREFWAVRNVSFDVPRGQAFGIVGRNGSGKSTLLQMIAGTLRSSEGECEIHGRAAALLELGSGFNSQFTGRENVYVNGAILGLPTSEIDRRFDEIIDFAEIGQFIDQPVKTYSSGMIVRLAFAVQVCVEPDILIIDEALSVGDIFFQQKCFARIRQILDSGTTILFVSHDLGTVRNICDRALLLDAGVPVLLGDASEVVARYHDVAARTESNGATTSPAEQCQPKAAIDSARQSGLLERKAEIEIHDLLRRSSQLKRVGQRDLEILAAAASDAGGRSALTFEMMERLTLDILCRANKAVTTPNIGIEIVDRFGTLVFSTGMLQLGHPLEPLAEGEEALVRLEVELSIQPGEYSLCLIGGITATDGNPNAGIVHDRIEQLGPLTIHYPPDRLFPFYGAAKLETLVSHDKLSPGSSGA